VDFGFESLPYDQAVNYFKSLGVQPTWSYQDLWNQTGKTAFTVAKLTELSLLEQVYDFMTDAIKNGKSLADFTNEMQGLLEQSGWGELSTARIENIYRTNMASAYSAGEWEQMQESALARAERGEITYLEGNSVGDERTREEHAEAMDGVILPIDDPYWDTHTPPLGFECRCWLTEMTEQSLERYGLEPSEEAPDLGTETVTDKDGNTYEVPVGVTLGFGGHNWDEAIEDAYQTALANSRLNAA
jgi:SPP1 gp7 family putative phage head morphogenesis protein